MGKRRSLLPGFLVAVGLVVYLAAVPAQAAVGPAGPQFAGPVDLSSRASIASYLGIDPNQVVWQTGLLNYAGPNCPGPGWNCVNTRLPVVQVTPNPGGVNKYECRDASCTSPTQVGPGKNEARCDQRSREPGAVLACVITQDNTGSGADNRAFVEQFIDQNDGSAQSGTETAQVTQSTTGDGDNFVHALQTINQSTKQGQIQSQDGKIDLNVNQTSQMGDNVLEVNQSEGQKASSSGVGPISQKQNSTDPGTDSCTDVFYSSHPFSDPNICTALQQTSDLVVGGSNIARVEQNTNQDQGAKNPVPGDITQQQGFSQLKGGIDTEHEQLGAAPAILVVTHREDQSQKAPFGASQTQFGPLLKGNEQLDNPNNFTGIDQTSTQNANSDADQTELVEANCVTSGNCMITQKVVQNGVTTTNSCQGMTCEASIVCGGFIESDVCVPFSSTEGGGGGGGIG